MTSGHFSVLQQVKSPIYLAGVMAVDMRGETCARIKTPKAPTRVIYRYIGYIPYSGYF